MKQEKVSEFFEKAKNKIAFFISEAKVPLILIIILLLVDLILGMITRAAVDSMPEQNITVQYSDDKCSQVSVFFAQECSVDDSYIKKMEYDFKNKLSDEAGFDPEKMEISSCFSAQGTVSIEYENTSISDINAIGVAGDFFFFHTLDYISGGPFTNDPTMSNCIVIDDGVAWDLFGSTDVCGKVVYINEFPHYISGVIRKKEGRIYDASGLKEKTIFMSYNSLCKYGQIFSGRTVEKEISEKGEKARFGGINCYEIVCPSPVDGIVKKYISESCGYDGRFVHICENSERFEFIPLLGVIASFGTRSMWQKAIFYPYWENIARGYEDILSILLIIRIFLRVSVGVTVILFVKSFNAHKEIDLHSFMEKLADKKYELEVKMNDRKKRKKEEK